MFDELLEKIQRVDEIERKLLSIFEGKSWEYIAKALYTILDDIDTASDMCKEDLRGFQDVVLNLQAKKNEFLSSDGYTLKPVVEIDSDSEEQPSNSMLLPDEKIPDDGCVCALMYNITECVCHIYGLDDGELLEFYTNTILNSDHYSSEAAQKQLPEDRAEVEMEIQKRGLDVNVDGEKFRMVGGIADSIKEFFDHKSSGKDEEYLVTFVQSRFGSSKLSEVLCNETIADRIWDFLRKNPDSTFNEILDGIDATGEVAGKFGDVVKDMLNKSIYVEDGKYHVVESLKENLTAHARRELELAGMFDKEVDGSEAAGSWNRLCAEAVMGLMELFAEQGHSGFSASMTQDLFSRLSKYEALTELTDNSDEWNDISEMQGDEPGWQSQRSPSCFSEDGGKTYWDIEEEYYIHEDEDGERFSGGLSEEEWNNRPMHQSKHTEKKE